MEEEKADDLFRLFTKTDAAAKQKKGLGFGAEEHGGFCESRVTAKHLEDVSFMQSMFVKEGTSTKKLLSAAESAAKARKDAEMAASARRSAANLVASKLAEKAAELKRQKQNSYEGHLGQDQGAKALHMRTELPKDKLNERNFAYEHKGREDAEEQRSFKGGRVKDSDYPKSKGDDDKPGRDEDRRRSPHTSCRYSCRSRSRSRSRERTSSRRDEGRRDREHKAEPRCHEGQQHDVYERRDDVFGSRGRDSKPEALSRRDVHQKSSTKIPNAASTSTAHFSRSIPGWNNMTPAERLKAQTRLSLQQASKGSQVRDHVEREAAIKDAESEGRLATEELAAARPWTRFVFDRAAPLDEQGARPSLAFLEEDRGDAGAREVEDAAFATHGRDGKPVGEVALNALSFRHNSQVAAQKQRESEHDAAIFGAQPQRVEEGSADRGPHISHNSDLMCKRGSQVGMYVSSRLDNDEDGPVIVTEEELKLMTSRSDEVNSGENVRLGVDGKEASACFLHQSDEIKTQQSTMTWRERAMQARFRKQQL
ncbi:hypothetical protein CEUSTIGMA_g3048.t1 [Chlamydomonas eustigma]|uniref:Uncharacterized protein n=1 Tax=Chlamydomonas eustigma TaxID=1157962 RepID=A0A250WXP3_9CHLO|nr:hypothetical protein CEUSTIGMA_g3048.t1 [Chlamydomonas eustigma]|eukprot:GAX75604.1 hypothetical protein CEUSTIGMA_g3048.t1 [Chlamydomonas eustigma]